MNFVQFKRKRIQEILPILKNAKISKGEHDCTQEPFFNRDEGEDFDIDFKQIDDVPEGLNYSVRLLFEIIGAPEKEVYIGPWTIMSYNKCMENYKTYCENGQKIVFDVALMYIGMGHVIVLSCDLDTHMLFYRRDGGSNGWDREANFKDLLKYDGTMNEQFFFNKWFFNLDESNKILNKYFKDD